MKNTLAVVSVLILFFAFTLTAASLKGKAEEYHHALNLCYQHSADHAKELFDQTSNGEFNLDIAKDFVEQIGKDLEHARIYHAMVHKTYSEADAKMIVNEHTMILKGHTAAAAAFDKLKEEVEKPNPSMETIKALSATIFDGASKAASAHRDAMKKLGVPESKEPGV
jgi:hypothetical protein